MGTLLEEMSSGMHNLFLVGIIKAKKEKEKRKFNTCTIRGTLSLKPTH
jgi:hypothetical protein